MNKELQIDDLTRGINDDEPMFNETEVQKQDTAHPGDKCWQDFMAYLEAPADVDGKAGWSASWTATWPTRSTTATSGAAAVPTS